VTAVKQYADQNGIILLSPLSTATSLATADNIFRFTPDDNFEGAAAAALAYADGMRTIIAVSRDDPGNLGLQASFKTNFERLGGRVVPGVTYPANETNFDTEAEQIAAALNANAANEGLEGVYYTAFAEVTGLFGALVDKGGEVVRSVPWYGSDSVALSKDLVADAKASQFAMTTRYPNPILGLRDADKAQWEPVNNRLTEELDRTPDAFALAAYDALNVAFQVMTNAGDRDVAGKKAELISITGSVTGLTGPLRLNDAGDRAIGIYDFWSVCQKNGAWTWYRSATYDPTGGAKQLGPC
jgi:branched-chain amino acid transport system substrate-binding protein